MKKKNVHRDFYENVHTSLNNSSKLETIQLYAYKRIDKHIMIFLYNGILLRKDVEQTVDMGNNLDKPQKQYVGENWPDPKEYMLYDSILHRQS